MKSIDCVIRERVFAIISGGIVSMQELRTQVRGVTWKHVNSLRVDGLVQIERGSALISLTPKGNDKAFRLQFPVAETVIDIIRLLDITSMSGDDAIGHLISLQQLIEGSNSWESAATA